MYKVKAKTLVVAQRARHPKLLLASTVAIATAAAPLAYKTVYCQHEADTFIRAGDGELRGIEQDISNRTLEMAESPYNERSSSSSNSSSHDHGHSSPHFSTMGSRSYSTRSGFRSSDDDENNRYRQYDYQVVRGNDGSTLRRGFRGPYVEEPLVPAVFYIAVAGLTGSILARKSNVIYKFLSPLTLAMGAAAYCIPRTTNNILYGLRTFDYTQWYHDLHHKYLHAKHSVVDTTNEVTAAAGSLATTVIHGTEHAAHDVSEKTQELSGKAHQKLKHAKDKTVGEIKHLGHELTHKVEQDFDKAKDSVGSGVEHVKQRWNSDKKTAESKAREFENAAKQRGEEAKGWIRSHSGFDRHDVEQQFDRFKDKAQENAHENIDNAERKFNRFKDKAQEKSHKEFDDAERKVDKFKNRTQEKANRDFQDIERKVDRFKDRAQDWKEDAQDDLYDVSYNGRSSRFGRDVRHKLEDWKDTAEDWADEREHDARRKFERAKDTVQDWAQDRGREGRRIGREYEDRFDEARYDAKRRGREARDFAENRMHDAQRDIRHRAEDIEDQGRRQLHKFKRKFDDYDRGYGGNSEDYDGRRGRYEERQEYGGRGRWNLDSNTRPHRSVTEAAKESRHWWPSSSSRHNNAADPYEWYDREIRPDRWETGFGSSLENSMREEYDHIKHKTKAEADQFRDSVDDKIREGQSWLKETKYNLGKDVDYKIHEGQPWLKDKKYDLQGRFDNVKHDLRNKFVHDQGREFGMRGHNHESIYSSDNWFHYDHGEEAAAGGGARRGRGERGL
ncbi:hypothetical protein FBU30_010963 [Linnemannia zychae]|nr:hypothetical protein FBU30_010963 [Linnemannia zychae]